MCITLVYNQQSLLMTLWNFSSSLWVRATPPSGISPLRQGRSHPWRRGGFFSLDILYQDQQKISSESLTEGQNDHLYLFLLGRSHPWQRGLMLFITISIDPISAMVPHRPTEGPSGFHYNFDIKSMRNIITIPNAGAKWLWLYNTINVCPIVRDGEEPLHRLDVC